MKRKYVHETLVDGALWHVLDCGHSHPAQQREIDALPVEEQECEQCRLTEKAKA